MHCAVRMELAAGNWKLEFERTREGIWAKHPPALVLWGLTSLVCPLSSECCLGSEIRTHRAPQATEEEGRDGEV